MKLCGFVLALLMGAHLTVLSNSVRVSVYYETLCPDCKAFIVKQLHPNYKLFGSSLVQLELIPYGNARETDVNGTKTFICQHGATECYGNEVEGCVVNSKPIETSESFVSCAEDFDPPSSIVTNLKHCARSNNIVWEEVEECLTSGKALDIMSENGRKTNDLAPQWVPTVVFNGKFNQADSNQAINDLRGVICKYLNNKPSQCGGFDASYNQANVVQI